MDIVTRLKEAADSGEIISIIYRGGSQPGAKRDIAPVRVTRKEIRARCYSSNAVKTFKIDKIVICGQEELSKPYDENITSPSTPANIIEALSDRTEDLRVLGWYVQIDEESISVHRFFKNGKPRKGADAGVLKNPVSPTRPWYVYGPDLASARTYRDLSKAVALFLEQAIGHAPHSSQT